MIFISPRARPRRNEVLDAVMGEHAMRPKKSGFTRRRFLVLLTVATASYRSGAPFACGSQNAQRTKTILSFYCDDTSPYAAGAEAFGTFLDFCARATSPIATSRAAAGTLSKAFSRTGLGINA
jgi:hypothetical protein